MSCSLSLLIVEDQPEICDLIELSLISRIPYIQKAHSLADAEKYIQKSNFTLAIIDASLPDGNSYSLIRELIKKECKIVLMSGNFQINPQIDNLSLPRIEKPFRIKHLIHTIEETLTKPFVKQPTKLVS